MSYLGIKTNTGSLTTTLTGDVNGVGASVIPTVLVPNGVPVGTYKSISVDATGRVISGSNPTTLAGYGITDAITPAQVPIYGGGLGSTGQTWQAVSRSLGVTYTNSTGKTIAVNFYGYCNGGGAASMYCTINGSINIYAPLVVNNSSGGQYYGAGLFIIPAGATYMMNWLQFYTCVLSGILELR